MKNSKYLDQFDEWAPAPVAPHFAPVAAPLRRLEVVTITWRGEAHRFEPEARLMFGQRTPVVSPITLWPPTADPEHPSPREGWAADIYIRNMGFVQGTGATPQEALDALDAELPMAPLVLGGSC
jgi:hypothetical protein